VSYLKAVIFDFGQVLSYPEKQSRIEEMARLCGLSLEGFRVAYRKYRPSYDRGDLKGIDYWRLVNIEASNKLKSKDIESLIDLDTANSIELNPTMLRWVTLLIKKKLRTAIISNMTPDDMSRMQRGGILKRLRTFDVKIFSSRVGLVKPENAVYEYCLTQLGLEPEEALFIDDMEANIEAARRLGMKVFLFHSTEPDLVTLSKQFNLPRPPSAHLRCSP
jgi:putative hydrolase of the HAD superfamily